MFETFDTNRKRYASVGVVSSIPSNIIDSIWEIIDADLKGVVPLTNFLYFDIIENQGKVSIFFSQEDSEIELSIDLPFPYNAEYPSRVLAYDDGTRETILLPSEIIKKG